MFHIHQRKETRKRRCFPSSWKNGQRTRSHGTTEGVSRLRCKEQTFRDAMPPVQTLGSDNGKLSGLPVSYLSSLLDSVSFPVSYLTSFSRIQFPLLQDRENTAYIAGREITHAKHVQHNTAQNTNQKNRFYFFASTVNHLKKKHDKHLVGSVC